MALSDEKLMLLEQITYMDKKVYDTLELHYPADRDDIINKIVGLSPDIIDKLEKMETKSDEINGRDWKEIILAIRSDSEIISYDHVEYNSEAGAYCFSNSDNEAVVAFRGTLNSNNEWRENPISLYVSDAPAQIVAADYVNSLTQYDSISIVGHSKGGNKAQYCTIVAEDVNIVNCVSMDGEGFSKEFLYKYSSQIASRGSKIKDYSYKSDFVNILLNDVPGSHQIYCDGSAKGAACHFSNSMFIFIQNGDEWEVVYSEVPQNPGMKYLHEFTCYMANNMSVEDRKKTADFLAELLDHLMGNKQNEAFDVEEYLMRNPECASMILAYLVAYVKEHKLSDTDIAGLLVAFGLENEEKWGIHILYWVKLIRALAEHLDETVIASTIAGEMANSSDWMYELAAYIAQEKGITEILNKYLPIIQNADIYYHENIEQKKTVRSDSVTTTSHSAGDVVTAASDTTGNRITVTPEQLKLQSAQMKSIKNRYDSISLEIVSIIKDAQDASSKNMQMCMFIKIDALINSIEGFSDLLEIGVNAAHTAALSYEHIDKELKKQILDL